MSLRIHYFQHVPFEDSANIAVWANQKGHKLTRTRVYEGDPFPAPNDIDWLIIMGGPMNIYEYDTYPWLLRERQFIKDMIKMDKAVIGVCLGAQLIADVLGAKVKRNKHREIGFFPVTLNERGRKNSLLSCLANKFSAFHWHGDRFEIPRGTDNLCKTQGCAHQAFQYGQKVLAMQFHLDYSIESVRKMIRHCSHELDEGTYVKKPVQMLDDKEAFCRLKNNLFLLLDNIEKSTAVVSQPANEKSESFT
jgi:GMP synthase (glutamine-hydrolysing)